MEDINNLKKVTIRDYSNYKLNTSNNGGDYAFFTYFKRINKENFEQTHESSADFNFCPFGQGFQECSNCPLEHSQDCRPDVVNVSELLTIVNKFKPEEIQVNNEEIIITIPEEE